MKEQLERATKDLNKQQENKKKKKTKAKAVKAKKKTAKRKKGRRTTMYSSKGKKLYAVRSADGKFKEGNKWTPGHNLRHPDMAGRYNPELPQGAPTSPGLANAICLRMDKRLDALARKFGATYTLLLTDAGWKIVVAAVHDEVVLFD